MKNKYIILSKKPWNKNLSNWLSMKLPDHEFLHMTKKEEFNHKKLSIIKPDFIFIPHWSYYIPDNIYTQYKCVIFHMTDLPYGRGGSPLQNLILNNHSKTKISALKVEKGIDSGPVYLKHDLKLNGTAQEIFERANTIIGNMIIEILEKKLNPKPQIGEPILFNRRKPNQSNISDINDPNKLFDYIRMLDAEGYPNAYLENKYFKFEFTKAKLNDDESIISNVRITKK